jgi:hypothetical protein
MTLLLAGFILGVLCLLCFEVVVYLFYCAFLIFSVSIFLALVLPYIAEAIK